MFKEVKCKQVVGNELIWKALYKWNRGVKETFFKNFACAFLFLKAIPQIIIMQKDKSFISKDNTGKSKKTKAIAKKKKVGSAKKIDLSPSDKFEIYKVIIEEYRHLTQLNFPLLNNSTIWVLVISLS